MDNESIAELVRKWLAGVGDILPVEELLERIKGREQWIANEIGWRDRLNYQQLEMLQKAEADLSDLRRQLVAARAEAADLRRQLDDFEELKDEAAGLSNVIRAHEGTLVGVRIKVGAMYHEDVLEAVQRAMDGKAQAEREGNDLRRQLAAVARWLESIPTE